jgi:hypothetical protein
MKKAGKQMPALLIFSTVRFIEKLLFDAYLHAPAGAGGIYLWQEQKITVPLHFSFRW